MKFHCIHVNLIYEYLTNNFFPVVTDMQPYTEYNASLTVCTEVGCTTSSNVSIMMPESQPEGKLQCLLSNL